MIAGEIFNAGYDNYKVIEIAKQVKDVIGNNVELEVLPTEDNRSYHISSKKIKETINFRPLKTIKNAIDFIVSQES